ncbi:MAG: hypothetical protein KJP09_04730 [Bacteroidia bacterium]|nr:hypothetical protein [Bacteroidia bacterium]NND09926.1 hypothetical protein [Flavobacteriaceae bacterium]
MSKLSAILLSSLILIQSINLSFDDALQLDELIEHAQFHKQEYGDNFIVFLSKHYGELKAEHSEKHQEEQKDHEQLPFQCQSHITLTAFVIQDSVFESDTLESTEAPEANFYYQSSFSSLHKKGILQPPKQA